MGITNSDSGILAGKTEYTRSYSHLRGVAFDGDQTGSEHGRFGYLQNMYVNYEGGGRDLESVPGYRMVYSFRQHINGILHQRLTPAREFLIVHAGTGLHRLEIRKLDSVTYTPSIATVQNSKSHGVAFDRDVYLFDGRDMVRIDPDGNATSYRDGTLLPYTPTTYLDGKPLEKRNLLTHAFREVTRVNLGADLAYGTPELSFEVIDEKAGLCAVTGFKSEFSGPLYIPSRAEIDGKFYSVYEIADHAFAGCESITELHLSPGIYRIGIEAFAASSLEKVYTSSTLTMIDVRAFADCASMSKFYLKRSVKFMGDGAFNGSSIKYVDYDGTVNDLAAVIGGGTEGVFFYHGSSYDEAIIALPYYSDIDTVSSLKCGERALDFEIDKDHGLLKIPLGSYSEIDSSELVIEGMLRWVAYQLFPNYPSVHVALMDCTLSETFDGRIFLTGNPNLRNVIFYCAATAEGKIDPTYYTEDTILRDGEEGYPIVGISKTNTTLEIYKEGCDAVGGIFRHSREKGYPLTYIHPDISVISAAGVMGDDMLYLTKNGIESLDRATGSAYRKSRIRSTNVNSKLLLEQLSALSFAKWNGYLAVCAFGNIYLADSKDTYTRDGGWEYEWYFMTGIEAHTDGRRIYRYASETKEGFDLSDTPDAEVTAMIKTYRDEDGVSIYYTEENGKKYLVYRTEEYVGGASDPANKIYSVGERLFFTTPGGNLGIFNNDKLGVPPDFISEGVDYDPEIYSEKMGRRLHPYFYSFDRYAPVCSVSTVFDDCGFSYLTKDTSPGTLTVTSGILPGGEIECSVLTDTGGYHESGKCTSDTVDFSEIDFFTLAFGPSDSFILQPNERQRNWIRKQITVRSDKFCSPFSIKSISHRFKIKGKIKKG